MADDRDARIAQLEAENAALSRREDVAVVRAVRAESSLAEELERQTATSEILRVSAGAPTDLDRVLDMIAESAARLCACENVSVYRTEGDRVREVALCGSLVGSVT